MRHVSNKNAADNNIPVQLVLRDVTLAGDLFIPRAATGIVVFAHGSGSSRLSPRNRFVADILHEQPELTAFPRMIRKSSK